MSEIKFGRKQVNNPSPASIVFWVRVGSAICGGIIGWMQTAAWIPANIQAPISSILGLLVMIANIVVSFFGVDVPEKSVPVEKVTAVEDKS